MVESMESLLAKIDRVLSEAEEPRVIDINDQAQRMWALKNCRGPCVGWDDYEAGRPYEPPRAYMGDIPLGPADDRGSKHSAEHGGVRPWSIAEVMETLIWPLPERTPYPDEDRDKIGLLWIIAKKSGVRNSYEANSRGYDKEGMEDAVAIGASATLRAIARDQSKKGVKFTGFIGWWIEEGMKSAVPAGYHNEYRYARGILSNRLLPIAKQARARIGLGEEIDDLEQRLVAELSAQDPDGGGADGIDREKGPNNRSTFLVNDRPVTQSLGNLVEKIWTKDPSDYLPKDYPDGPPPPGIVNVLAQAMRSRDEQEIADVVAQIERTQEEIGEQEDQYTIHGPKTGGGVINNPKDSIFTQKGFVKKDDIDASREERRYELVPLYLSDEGVEAVMAIRKETEVAAAKLVKSSPRRKKALAAYGAKLKAQGKLIPQEFRAAMDAKEKELGPMFPAKIHDAVRAERQRKEEEILSSTDLAALKQIDQQTSSENAPQSVSTGLSVTSRKSGKQIERPGLEQGISHYDVLASAENRDVIARILSMARSGLGSGSGWVAEKALNAISRLENAVKMADADPQKQVHSIRSIVDASKDIDEYGEEISEIGQEAIRTITSGDDLDEVLGEIELLRNVASQDASGQKTSYVDPLTTQEYRVIIRVLGIDNYPERGTVDDPEIDPSTGESSAWVNSGYRQTKSNNEIAQDLWSVTKGGERKPISQVRVSQIRKSAMAKLDGIIERQQSKLREEIDQIDFAILTEIRVLIGRALIEDVIFGSVLMG